MVSMCWTHTRADYLSKTVSFSVWEELVMARVFSVMTRVVQASVIQAPAVAGNSVRVS